LLCRVAYSSIEWRIGGPRGEMVVTLLIIGAELHRHFRNNYNRNKRLGANKSGRIGRELSCLTISAK